MLRILCLFEQFRSNLCWILVRALQTVGGSTYISMFQNAFQIQVKRKLMKNSPFYKYCLNGKLQEPPNKVQHSLKYNMMVFLFNATTPKSPTSLILKMLALA